MIETHGFFIQKDVIKKISLGINWRVYPPSTIFCKWQVLLVLIQDVTESFKDEVQIAFSILIM